MGYRDLVDLVSLGAVWGASFLFMRVAAPEFGVIALIAMRVLIALLFLLPFFFAHAGLDELRANWKPIAVAGALSSALPFCLLAFATLHLTGGLVSIVNATTPMFGALIGWLWLSERLTRSQNAGLLIGLCGVVILVGDRLSLSLDGGLLAVLAAILASLCYGTGANFAKKNLINIRAITTSTGTMIAATIILLPAAAWNWPDAPVSGRAWLAVSTMGIASTGIAYLLFYRLLASVGSAKALTVTYLVPAFAVLWGALFIDEAVTADMLIGGAVILTGISLVTGLLAPGKPAPPAAP